MKVKIIKSTIPDYWYANRIGQIFEVEIYDSKNYEVINDVDDGSISLIKIEDVIEFTESDDLIIGNSIDIKYLGIPNICFSLTKKNDKREIDYIKQRIERGFDDSETWSLRDTIANFIIPRLERYEEISKDFLKRDAKLLREIDDFLIAMKLIVRDDGICIFTEEEEKQVSKGLENFSKIFMTLWW